MNREEQYRPYHVTWPDENIPTSVEALEKIAFQFPACSNERVQILWAVDKIRGETAGFRRWG